MKLSVLNRVPYLLVVFALLFLPSALMAVETKEKTVEVSDTEKAQFEKDLEDRLTRDIQAYLGNNNFILGLNAELKKVVVYQEVPMNAGSLQDPNAPQNYREEKLNTIEQIGNEPNQGSDFDIVLPGLPTSPEAAARLREQSQGPTGTKTVFEQKINPTQGGNAINAPTGEPRVDQVVLEEKIKIKNLQINTVLDNQITAEQEQFVRSIIMQKAKLSVIRGDELIITKTDFPGAKKAESEMTPWEGFMQWLQNNWYWLLAAIVALLILWFILGRKNKDQEAATVPVETPTTAADLVLRDPEEAAASAEIEAIKEQIVSLSVSHPSATEEYITSLSASGDEVEKTKLVVLYNSLGHALFASLYKDVFSKADLDQIASSSRDLAQNLNTKDSAVYMHDLYKGMMNNFLESQRQKEQGHQLRPFSFLKDLDNAQIVYLISDEANKVKAIVLSQLASDRAAAVIRALNDSEKNIVVAEMSRIRDVPLASLRSIASMLAKKARTAPSFDNVTVDGVDLIVDILDRMDSAAERDMLASLGQDDPELYHNIRQIYITFDDLPRLPSLALKNLTREVERETLALALYDVDDAFQETVLQALPERPRLMTKNMIAGLTLPEEAQVQNAKRSVSRKAREMLKGGLFDISELGQS